MTKEKKELARLLSKGYEPCGMFNGYVLLISRLGRILYDKKKDEVVNYDKEYFESKYFGGG